MHSRPGNRTAVSNLAPELAPNTTVLAETQRYGMPAQTAISIDITDETVRLNTRRGHKFAF